MSSMFTCCQQSRLLRGIPSLASSPISKIIGLPGRAVNPILGIICHMLIMLQPIKSMFFLVYSLM